MSIKREKSKVPARIYLEKAQTLSKGEAELLKHKVLGRFTLRRDDKKLSPTEVLALQLEFDDKQLAAWRHQLAKIRETAKHR